MNELYTPREAAAELLQERQQNPELVALVREYLGNALPSTCLELGERAAFLARYVPRATNEDRLFADIAREDGFVPQWASYAGDRFTTRNPEKVATVRPTLLLPKNQRTRSWVVEPENREGGIGQLQTRFGYSSTEYHAGLRGAVLARDGNEDLIGNTFDMGDWYKLQAPRFGYTGGNLAPYYYPATMALTTAFGVLYEDFDGGPNAGSGDLEQFTNAIVRPAFYKAWNDLGVKPIIVQLPYQEGLDETVLEFLEPEQVPILQTLGSKALGSGTMELV